MKIEEVDDVTHQIMSGFVSFLYQDPAILRKDTVTANILAPEM